MNSKRDCGDCVTVKVCVFLSQPRYLFSSTSVLQSQRATCFESATLLCSLLLGVHYDAYCVSGYAVRELCLLDQSLQECPLLDTEAKVRAALGAVHVTAHLLYI